MLNHCDRKIYFVKGESYELDACLHYKPGCFSFGYFETWGHFQEQIFRVKRGSNLINLIWFFGE